MQGRSESAMRISRKFSVRYLALRTVAVFMIAAVLSAALYSLIRSEGISETKQEKRRTHRKTAIDVSIVADLDERLLLDSLGKSHEDLPLLRSHTATRAKLPVKQSATIYESEEFHRQLDQISQKDQSMLQQSHGVVKRLHNSVDQPLGISSDRDKLCAPFSYTTQNVGIVGNGPLSAQDRADIEGLDVIIRFNLMNNWQRFKEKIDVWIMRYSTEASAGYWGINNINQTEADQIIQSLKGVWLVGGNQTHADRLAARHPDMLLPHCHPVLLPEAAMNKAFAAVILQSPHSYPSTGFVGIQAALHCTQASVKLHIYGFNWSQKTWSGHNVDAEKLYVLGLQEQGRAVIHQTSCNGMRECGEGDIDPSCHWSTEGRYMCLRGKPRKWKDMTSMVETQRVQEFSTRVQ